MGFTIDSETSQTSADHFLNQQQLKEGQLVYYRLVCQGLDRFYMSISKNFETKFKFFKTKFDT